MALAGRSTRRSSGGSRVLVAALVVTLIVLLIDASVKSRSQNPVERLSAQAWVDQTLPLIRASTEQGQQINAIRADSLSQKMTASAIASQVNQTAAAAASTYRSVKRLVPPTTYSSAGGLLDACMLLREQAASTVAKTLVATLSGPPTPTPSASSDLSSAALKFQSGDQLYQLFTQSLPGLGVTMPASAWATNAGLFQSPKVGTFLDALRNSTNLTPIHKVVVQAVSTSPPAESVVKGIQVLPNAQSITVEVDVANEGNQVESGLSVTATILPAVKEYPTKHILESLPPGVAQSLTLGGLYPVIGRPVTLTVTVTPPAGSALAPVTRTLTFEMPMPGTALTTTTTTPGAKSHPAKGKNTTGTSTASTTVPRQSPGA
jgi:hypothetical protein